MYKNNLNSSFFFPTSMFFVIIHDHNTIMGEINTIQQHKRRSPKQPLNSPSPSIDHLYHV